jgi:hypothetical protein
MLNLLITTVFAMHSPGSQLPLADIGPHRLWYAIPLVISVSLVYAATRHEEMGPILVHAVRFAIWIVVFMGVVLALIQLMTWMI